MTPVSEYLDDRVDGELLAIFVCTVDRCRRGLQVDLRVLRLQCIGAVGGSLRCGELVENPAREGEVVGMQRRQSDSL